MNKFFRFFIILCIFVFMDFNMIVYAEDSKVNIYTKSQYILYK
jgi:hypothetical protein